MPTSFFDRIKLFKGAEIQPGHPTAPPEDEKPRTFVQKLVEGPWLVLVVTSVIIAACLTSLPARRLSSLTVGAVAPADVIAPFDLIIEDAEATVQKKDAAVAAVLPVYTFDANIFANTEDKVRALFAMGRAWTARF